MSMFSCRGKTLLVVLCCDLKGGEFSLSADSRQILAKKTTSRENSKQTNSISNPIQLRTTRVENVST